MNNLKAVVFIIIILITLSCEDEGPKMDWNKSKTVAIVTDLRILDNQIKKHKFHQKDSVKTLYREQLLKTHKITQEELDKNLTLLQSDPDLIKEIEIKVLERLEKRIEEIKENSK